MTRNRWIILGGVLVVAAIALIVVRGRAAPPAASQTSQRTATIEEGPIQVTVTGTGNIEPNAAAGLAFTVAGNVGQVYVKVGDQVRAGQALMDLDPNSLDASLVSAQANLVTAQQNLNDLLNQDNWQLSLAQAQSDLANAQDQLHTAEYDRSVKQQGNRASQLTIDGAEARLKLAKDNLDQAKRRYDNVSGDPTQSATKAVALTNWVNAQNDYNSALRALNWYKGKPTDIQQAQYDSAVAVAQAKVDQAQQQVDKLQNGPDPDKVAAARAQVQAAQAMVNQSRLMAPFDGRVMAIYYRPGDREAPGSVAIELDDVSQYHIVTNVDELDIASVQIGQPATISLDALPGVQLSGKVDEIDLSPDPTSTTTEYPVRIALTNPDKEARVGMTASIDIQVASQTQALLVPNWALQVDSNTGQIYVEVLSGGTFSRQDVTLGLRNDSVSQVVKGLKVGDVIGLPNSTPQPSQPSGFFGGG